MKAEPQQDATLSAIETPESKAGRCLAYDVVCTIDMINELWQQLQDAGDGYDGSAFAGFGMLLTARLRVALNKFETATRRADA